MTKSKALTNDKVAEFQNEEGFTIKVHKKVYETFLKKVIVMDQRVVGIQLKIKYVTKQGKTGELTLNDVSHLIKNKN